MVPWWRSGPAILLLLSGYPQRGSCNHSNHTYVHFHSYNVSEQFDLQAKQKSTSTGIQHIQNLSSAKAPWSNKTLSLYINLKTYQSIHTGDKPFACSQCDRSFPHLVIQKHTRVPQKDSCSFCVTMLHVTNVTRISPSVVTKINTNKPFIPFNAPGVTCLSLEASNEILEKTYRGQSLCHLLCENTIPIQTLKYPKDYPY